MGEPQRIQLSRQRGYRKPPGAIVVSRPSRWGNMFKAGGLIETPGPWKGPAIPREPGLPLGEYTGYDIMRQPYTYEIRAVRGRAEAVELFTLYIRFHDDEWPPEVIRRELGGRDLCCWCPLPIPGEPDICHGSILLRLAAGEPL